MTTISAGTQPARLMIAACPAMSEPVGRVTAARTPLARVTGISSESGLMPVAARRSGWKSPPSRKSCVSRAESISTSPRTVPASIMPGYRCRPVASIRFARADAPPMWLATGAADTLVRPRNAEVLAAREAELGNRTTVLREYPGLGHVGVLTAIAKPLRFRAPVLNESATFLAEHSR